MWLIAQGLFFNHPFYTEVGEFQCGERKNDNFISLPEIIEVWWLHFEINVIQIGYIHWKPERWTTFISARQMLHSERQSQKPRDEKAEV